MNKVISFLLLCLVVCSNLSAQTSTNLYDSLIVNTWRFKSLEIDKKDVALTDVQKQSKMIFRKNHTSEQQFDDMVEKGKWQVNQSTSTVEVFSDILPDESVSYKILKLTTDSLVLQIKNEVTNQDMIFSLYKEEI